MTYNYKSDFLAYNSYYELTVNVYTEIMPSHWRNKQCIAIPNLPEGLSFNDCAIVGIPVVLQTNTTYRIFSFDNMTTSHYSFVISVVDIIPENEEEKPWWIVVVIVGLVICGVAVFVWICHNQKNKKKTVLPVIPVRSTTEVEYYQPQSLVSEPIAPSSPARGIVVPYPSESPYQVDEVSLQGSM